MANFNFNKAILGGRLVADPELKQTQSGIPVCSFTVAVSRRYQSRNNNESQSQPQADFINIVAWRQQAEFVTRYFRKGVHLYCRSVQTRSWTDNQNKNDMQQK